MKYRRFILSFICFFMCMLFSCDMSNNISVISGLDFFAFTKYPTTGEGKNISIQFDSFFENNDINIKNAKDTHAYLLVSNPGSTYTSKINFTSSQGNIIINHNAISTEETEDLSSVCDSRSFREIQDFNNSSTFSMDRTARNAVSENEPIPQCSYAVGDTAFFYPVWSTDGNATTYLRSGTKKSFKLWETNEYCNIWIGSDEYSTVTGNSNINTIKTPSKDAIQYVRDICGNEKNTLTDGTSIDGKVNILLFDFNAGSTIGLFYSRDYNPKSKYPTSNEGKFIYLNSEYLTSSYTDDLCSTIAHEFQHLIHYCNKEGRSETWFNEMCSMLIEDMLSVKLSTGLTGSSIYRIGTFKNKYYLSGLKKWDGNLANYAYNLAFGAYLARNFGGEAFVSAMIKGMQVNENAISYALKECGNSIDTFEKAFANYGQAVLNDKTTTDSTLLSFNNQINNTYNFVPIMLWEKTFSSDFDKMKTFSLSDSISIQPYGFIIYDLGTITEDNITFSINSTASINTVFTINLHNNTSNKNIKWSIKH